VVEGASVGIMVVVGVNRELTSNSEGDGVVVAENLVADTLHPPINVTMVAMIKYLSIAVRNQSIGICNEDHSITNAFYSLLKYIEDIPETQHIAITGIFGVSHLVV
jgi:hypothetical protein